MAINRVYSGRQRGPLGSGLWLRTHCSDGRTEAGQVWHGLGTWGGVAGQGQRMGAWQSGGRKCPSHSTRPPDEHGVPSGPPPIEHNLITEHLEDGHTERQWPQVSSWEES